MQPLGLLSNLTVKPPNLDNVKVGDELSIIDGGKVTHTETVIFVGSVTIETTDDSYYIRGGHSTIRGSSHYAVKRD